jgi:pyruvate/2-oxoglutarate dehydrogenase complex dihydrolipoamide acyltransferase (E2) component
MNVTFTYRNGKSVVMQERYAEILQKMKRGTYSTTAVTDYNTRDMRASGLIQKSPVIDTGNSQSNELLISDAVRKFAEENLIDIAKVIGTGKDGRINKNDIEDAIAARTTLQDK